MKSTFYASIKILFSLGLIYWLIINGKLDLRAFDIIFHRPEILAASLAYWLIGPVCFCAFRWYNLLKGAGFEVKRKDIVQLNAVGIFFNAIMPGAVGGDVVKAVYICRGLKKGRKMHVLLTLLIDRILGLLGLFVICFLMIILNYKSIAENQVLSGLALGVGFIIFAMLGAALLFLKPGLQKKIPLLGFVFSLVTRFRLGSDLFSALGSYRDKPKYFWHATAYGFAHQALTCGYYIAVTAQMVQAPLPLGLIGTVLPFGILLTALPLSPGGLGVGHVGFEKLYALIGISDGANIFNVVFISILMCNLMGCVPYIFASFNGTRDISYEKL